MCRRGACLASESSSIPIRGPKPLSVKGAFRRWKTYRGNGHKFLSASYRWAEWGEKRKKIQSVLEASSSSSRSLPPSLPPPPTNQNFIRIPWQFSGTPFILLGGERLCESKLFCTRLQHIVPARPTLEPGLLDWESSVLTIRPPATTLTKIKLVKWKNRKIPVKNSSLVWRGLSVTSYNIYTRSRTYSWESFCDRGPDGLHLAFANGTLSAMLDEVAWNLWKVSDESLGRDETPRHPSHEFSLKLNA